MSYDGIVLYVNCFLIQIFLFEINILHYDVFWYFIFILIQLKCKNHLYAIF